MFYIITVIAFCFLGNKMCKFYHVLLPRYKSFKEVSKKFLKYFVKFQKFKHDRLQSSLLSNVQLECRVFGTRGCFYEVRDLTKVGRLTWVRYMSSWVYIRKMFHLNEILFIPVIFKYIHYFHCFLILCYFFNYKLLITSTLLNSVRWNLLFYGIT